MANSLWEWSAIAYETPGAKETLLTLQDAHGLNVSLMLWCVWTAVHFAEPDEATLRRAMMVAGEWEDPIIAPLRGVRRRLKSREGFDSLVQKVMDAELGAERELQAALEVIARRQLTPASGGDADRAARRTLAAYARAAGAGKRADFSISLLENVAGLAFSRFT